MNPEVVLIASPQYSIKMLEEEIENKKRGHSDFTKDVDWRISTPLGLLYIAGMLKKNNYNVKIYDLHKAFYACRENGYFKQRNLSDFMKEHLEEVLIKDSPKVLGISCLFNVASTSVEEIVKRSKKISPEIKIVLGGHYPTREYKKILKNRDTDYIILGEAEEQFKWLIDNIDNSSLEEKIMENPHIVNLQSMDNKDKRAAVIENLDSLAFPSLELLEDYEDYIQNSIHTERIGSSLRKKKIRSAQIFTTRGCPMECTFCAAHGVHGKRVRAHSIDYMMRYIDELVEKHDINNLLIEDDLFNFSEKRTMEFCNKLHEKYNGRFNVEFPNGLAIWNLNDGIIEGLKK